MSPGAEPIPFFSRLRRGGGKFLGLWYVLASTYLVAALGVNRILAGAWNLDWALVAHLLAASMLQLLALWLLSLVWPLFPGDKAASHKPR